MSELTIKDLLGIDFDDKGLAETIDSVTNNQIEMGAIQSSIGIAIFEDGGLLEDDLLNPNDLIKKVAWENDKVMNMICYYASKTDSFMERLSD